MARRHLLAAVVLASSACSDGTGTSEPPFAIEALAPNRISPGTNFVLTVVGRGFADSAVIELNGQELETFFTNATQVSGLVSPQALPEPDTAVVVVVNPDGRRSNRLRLPVVPGAIPFRVDSISPAFDTEVDPGGPLVAYFSEALDPASISDTSLTARREDGTVSSGPTYDADRHALVLTGALTPAARFTGHVAFDLRAQAGGALDRSPEWIFSTSFAPAVILSPAGSWPTVVLGLDGQPRVGYQERVTDTDARLALATCIADCTTAAGWSHAAISPAGALGNYAALAIGPDGRLHFAHQEFFDEKALYVPAANQSVLLATRAAYTSIAVAPSGRLHLTYYAVGDLYHATCTGACTDAASWVIGTVDTVGNVGSFSSVVSDAGGGMHMSYFENDSGDLRYAACPAPCTAPTWTSGSVDTTGRTGIGSSILVGGDGRVHLAWLNQEAGAVMYGTCATDCTTMDQWTTTPVETVGTTDFGLYYSGLALGPTGRLELSYTTADGRIRHATCTGNCAAGSASWVPFTLSLRAGGELGVRFARLAIDGDGQRHLVWTDRDGGIRYMRY